MLLVSRHRFQLIGFQPCGHIPGQRGAAGIVDGQPLPHVGFRGQLGDGRQALAEAPAAVGAEGNDALSPVKVLGFAPITASHSAWMVSKGSM